jgi:hypothetical protein
MGSSLSSLELDSSEMRLFEGLPYPTQDEDPVEQDRLELIQKKIIVQYRESKHEDGEIDPVRFTSNLILLCSSHYRKKDKFIILFALCAFLSQDGIISSILTQSKTNESKKKFVNALHSKLGEMKTFQNDAVFHKNIEIILQWLEWDDSLEIKEPE